MAAQCTSAFPDDGYATRLQIGPDLEQFVHRIDLHGEVMQPNGALGGDLRVLAVGREKPDGVMIADGREKHAARGGLVRYAEVEDLGVETYRALQIAHLDDDVTQPLDPDGARAIDGLQGSGNRDDLIHGQSPHWRELPSVRREGSPGRCCKQGALRGQNGMRKARHSRMVQPLPMLAVRSSSAWI